MIRRLRCLLFGHDEAIGTPVQFLFDFDAGKVVYCRRCGKPLRDA